MSETIASFPWTTTTPTVPGFYLFRSPASAQTVVRVKQVSRRPAVLDLEFLEDGETEEASEPGVGDEWAGPLTAQG